MKTILLFLSVFISTAYRPHPAAKHYTHADLVLICDSKGAKVYHSYQCRGLSNCTHKIIKISKSDAARMGRRACKICY